MPEPRASHVRKLVYASLFAALTCVGAQAQIPFVSVPVTLQTLFTLMAGAVLGPYFGALSMVVYVLLGLVGLPVFTGYRSGLGELAGPLGGYLVGFVVSAAVTGMIVKAKNEPGYLWICFAMAVGVVVIYACGVPWLMLSDHMPLSQAVVVGALVFVPFDVLKIILGAYATKKLRPKVAS